MKTKTLTSLVAWPLLLLVFSTPVISADNPKDQPVRKAAIFVDNRAGATLNDKVAAFEDSLTSRLAGKGFALLSRDAVVQALGKNTTLDKLLQDNTTAQRLAQNLGADSLIIASITSLGSEKKTFKDANLETVNMIHTLRVTGRILDAAQGAAWAGETVMVNKTIRFTANSQTESSDLFNELLDEAATKLADALSRRAAALPVPVAPALAEFTIACGMQDLAQLPVSVPDVRVKPDGTVFVGTNRYEVVAMDVTVELDGTVIGSAPGAFKAAPGLHKIRLTREGFNAWERTINIYPGQQLKVAIQMSEAGYARWQNNLTFLLALKTGEKLTDAAVTVAEGFAQTLRQSGYRVDNRVDVKADIKTDVKALIEAKGKSLFEGANFKTSLFPDKDKDKDK